MTVRVKVVSVDRKREEFLEFAGVPRVGECLYVPNWPETGLVVTSVGWQPQPHDFAAIIVVR